MRNHLGTMSLILFCCLIASADAGDRRDPPRREPSRGESSKIRRTSLNVDKPGGRIELAAPRLASRADVPLLLAPTLADQGEPVQPPPAPAPAAGSAPVPIPDSGHSYADFEPGPPTPIDGASVSLLYPHVCYKDLDNVAPCAVPMVVSVPNPCKDCGCVFVKICVPANCRPTIVCKHFGRGLKYQFGDYQVEIKPKKDGTIVVDYDD